MLPAEETCYRTELGCLAASELGSPGCQEVALLSLPGRRDIVPQQDSPSSSGQAMFLGSLEDSFPRCGFWQGQCLLTQAVPWFDHTQAPPPCHHLHPFILLTDTREQLTMWLPAWLCWNSGCFLAHTRVYGSQDL